MATSDYSSIFQLWSDPGLNLTTYRRLVEATLSDDARFEAFVSEAKARKNESEMHRAFYIRAKFDHVGLTTKDKSKCLSKMEKIKLDNSIIKECLGRMIPVSDNEEEIEKVKKLLSEAAYDGNKNAVRQLCVEATRLNLNKKTLEDVSGIFLHPTSPEPDPFYQVFYEGFKSLGNVIHPVTDLVDAIIELDMPNNKGVFNVILVNVMLTMLKIDFIADNKDEELVKMKDVMMKDLKRLYQHCESYFTKVRTLPKHRDPFRIYSDKFDEQTVEIIAKWKNFIN